MTGASRGIGKAIALALAGSGADVVVHAASRRAEAEDVASEVRTLGVRASVILENLVEYNAGRRLVERACGAVGQVDILVANASVQYRTPWTGVSSEQFDYQTAVNLRSTMELMQASVPAMAERRWGRVVTIGSIQQVKPHPEMAVYAATKCAVVSLVRSVARDVAARGVTVNNLALGVVETDRNASALQEVSYRERVLANIPAGELGRPEDCSGLALLLCSDAGRYITGADIPVDGGMHLT